MYTGIEDKRDKKINTNMEKWRTWNRYITRNCRRMKKMRVTHIFLINQTSNQTVEQVRSMDVNFTILA
jgi:hypothetical protein